MASKIGQQVIIQRRDDCYGFEGAVVKIDMYDPDLVYVKHQHPNRLDGTICIYYRQHELIAVDEQPVPNAAL